MEIIPIEGSVAETKLNGYGNAILKVLDGKVVELIYVRDLIRGWVDKETYWQKKALSYLAVSKEHQRMSQDGVVYLGVVIGSSFAATWD